MQRREFFQNMAGTAAVGLFGASLTDLRRAGEYVAAVGAQQPYEYLNAEQVRLLDAVTAQIVPTDDTPGAREAHVVRFIDHTLATFFKQRRGNATKAMAALEKFSLAQPGAKKFADRSADDQTKILKAFEKKDQEHCGFFRNMTMAGMFNSPVHGGNYDKIGYKLIGFEDQYSWAPPFGYYDR
jgi:gluconate 2-dehydrogenase gamma chain